MLKIVLFLLTLCFVVPLDAQEVYYPLNVGDGWQLRQITWTNPPIYSFIHFMIVSDTTMPNGHTYARSDGWYPRLQRQQGHQVLSYSILDSTEYVMYDFSRSIGDTVGMYVDGDTFDVVLADTAVRTVFGQPRRTWTFLHVSRQLIDADTRQVVADSIGLVELDGFIGPYSLMGTVISGKTYGTIVGAPYEEPLQTSSFQLFQNYPNPFNPSTTIRYVLPERSDVTLLVFNTLGQQVAVLQNGEQQAGYHEVQFDASHLASGVYLYRLTAGSFVETRKLLLVR